MIKYIFPLFAAYTMTLAQPSIRYSLSMPSPWNHLFEVEMTLDDVSSSSINISMPAWRTGRYMILDFAGEVQEFHITDAKGFPVEFSKIDKDTWHIENGRNHSLTVKYKVYANEFNLRTRELNSDHGFLDPSAVFMYVDGQTDQPVQLTIHPFGSWHVTTGMNAVPGRENVFTAPSFEYFIDCPIEIGNQKDFAFTAGGKHHVISIYGEGNWNSDTLIADFTKIILANKNFWGELPYEKFVFIIHCQPNAGGGTEHINSTVMGTRPFVFVNKNSYSRFLSLVSHEYFHTWNVKRIRPKAIAPFDLSTEAYTKELWISEGMTDYYGALIRVYAGLMTPQSFLDRIPGMVASDRSRYGNTIQPLSESSFDAWIKYWKGLQNSRLAQSDYYEKGDDVSLLLDLEIRNRTRNKASLQTVMRAMFKKFSPAHGFTNADFISLCDSITGTPMKEFFDHYLYATTPLPWEQTLQYAGLELTPKDSIPHVQLGIMVDGRSGKIRVSGVVPGSSAEEAHLEVNDEIISLNGFRIQPEELNDRVGECTAGTVITLGLFRNDRLMDVPVRLKALQNYSYTITKIEHPSPLQKSIYESWINQPF